MAREADGRDEALNRDEGPFSARATAGQHRPAQSLVAASLPGWFFFSTLNDASKHAPSELRS